MRKISHKSMDDVSEGFYIAWLRAFLKKTFPLWERLGFHITANHFYEPVPNVSKLHKEERLWQRPASMRGVQFNRDRHLEWLNLFKTHYAHEYNQFPARGSGKRHEFYLQNDFFECVDAEIMYSFVRHCKPARIIEIGSGFSTALISMAVRKNQEVDGCPPCHITAIEPYPSEELRTLPGLTELIPRPVQDVPPELFETLRENDILTIDSSHILKTGSDVQYEYLKVLPRLAPGVLVHIHDIFLPFEYPKKWVLEKKRFCNEQYLLHAFLIGNGNFEVLWPSYYIHMLHPQELGAAIPSYTDRTPPTSFWIRRTR